MKKYGVDLDGVVYKFDKKFAEWLNTRRGLSINHKAITTWQWYDCFPEISKEMFTEEFDAFTKAGMFQQLEEVEDAIDGIRKLKLVGQVYIITSRPAYSIWDTFRSLERHFNPIDSVIDGIFFSKHKDAVVNSNNIDVMIDDGPHIAEQILLGTKAHMYIMDRPYNYGIDAVKKATRVYSWKDILHREGIHA